MSPILHSSVFLALIVVVYSIPLIDSAQIFGFTDNGSLRVSVEGLSVVTSLNYTIGTPTSRSVGTTYGPSTGTIWVTFSAIGNSGNFRVNYYADISSDGTTWYNIGSCVAEWSSMVHYGSMQFMLPEGWYYRILIGHTVSTFSGTLSYYEFPLV